MPSTRIGVHVTPKSGRDQVVGWRGSELSVRVAASPEGGKANSAACTAIARALGIPKSSVRVVRGEASRHKLVEVEGVSAEDVRSAFGVHDSEGP